MKMSSKNEVKVKLGYGDSTTRTYTMPFNGNINDTAPVKAAITAFNTAASISGSDVKRTFVSDDGSQTTGIVEAQIVVTTEEVLYNAN